MSQHTRSQAPLSPPSSRHVDRHCLHERLTFCLVSTHVLYLRFTSAMHSSRSGASPAQSSNTEEGDGAKIEIMRRTWRGAGAAAVGRHPLAPPPAPGACGPTPAGRTGRRAPACTAEHNNCRCTQAFMLYWKLYSPRSTHHRPSISFLCATHCVKDLNCESNGAHRRLSRPPRP